MIIMRLLVLLLVLANAAYFAWSQGLLRAYGFAPVQQAEPHRVAQQVRPDVLTLLTPDDLKRLEAAAVAAAPAPAPAVCLQAGLFDEAQAGALREALATLLPAQSWVLEPATEPGRWLVYMGKFANAPALAAKRRELADLKVVAQPLNAPPLGPGLSLGDFDSPGAANARLAALVKTGVRSARVVQERPELRGSLLRLPAVDDALRAQLPGLAPALGSLTLQPCR